MAGTDGKGEYAAVEKKEKVILILLTMFIVPTISRLRLKENDKCSRSRRWRRSPGG